MDVLKKERAPRALDVQDTVALSVPALARMGGLVEITEAKKEFAANAAALRAEGECGERLLEFTA